MNRRQKPKLSASCSFDLCQAVSHCDQYHLLVSRLFLLFLIVSLPFRGWAVERMALQMDSALPGLNITQDVDADMRNECALHMQKASDFHGTVSAHDSPNKGCQSCQLCMALAALDIPAAFAVTTIQHSAPVLRTSDFASADTARCAKPPIS
jgi:hypothetical protein